MFESYRDVTPEFLHSIGVSALLVDIDNTLAPYEQPIPDADNLKWFSDMEHAGVKISLVSNNSRDRVELFSKGLNVDVYPKSGKPGTKTLFSAMEKMGSNRQNTAVLGDQLLTDALAGHNAGLKAIIVPPIRDKRNLFFRFKRLLEKPTVRQYRRLHPEFNVKSVW